MGRWGAGWCPLARMPMQFHVPVRLRSVGGLPVQVSVTWDGLVGGWLAASPTNGSIAGGAASSILLTYDVSDTGFQGVYTAQILVTTDAHPSAKVRYTAGMRVTHWPRRGLALALSKTFPFCSRQIAHDDCLECKTRSSS
jgi:hypothetical protein